MATYVYILTADAIDLLLIYNLHMGTHMKEEEPNTYLGSLPPLYTHNGAVLEVCCVFLPMMQTKRIDEASSATNCDIDIR